MFEIPSTDKHPFVALLSLLKSHGSFSLCTRLSDVGKAQLPICRGCAVFVNVKQSLKMRPHKLWRMDRLICFLAQALTAFFFLVCVFVSATGQLITKPPSLLHYSTLWRDCGQQGDHCETHLGRYVKEYVDGWTARLIYVDNDLLKDVECKSNFRAITLTRDQRKCWSAGIKLNPKQWNMSMAGHPTPEAVNEDITSVGQLECMCVCVWTSKRTSVLLNLCVCVLSVRG